MTRLALPSGTVWPDYEFGSFADFSDSANVSIIVGTGCTLETDTTVTYRGRPTTKLTVAAGAAADIDIGISSASLLMTDEHRQAPGLGPLFVVKSDLATTGLELRIGYDANYTQQVKLYATSAYVDAEGFSHYTGRGVEASVVTVTGAIGFVGSKQWKLRYKRAGSGAGTIWFAHCGIAPRTRCQVILSFDDAWDDHYNYVYPEAIARDLPISLSVRTSTLDSAGYCTTAQLEEMNATGMVDLNNHAVNLDNRTTLGDAAYVAEVKACRDWLIAHGADSTAAHIHNWVQGDYSTAAIDLLIADGFKCGREVGQPNRSWKPYHIAQDATKRSWFVHPQGAGLTTGTSVATVKGYLETAIARGSVFWVMGHKFEAAAAAETWINSDDATYGFETLLDHLVYLRDAGRIDVVKASDWFKSFEAFIAGTTADHAAAPTRSAAPTRQTGPTRIAA